MPEDKELPASPRRIRKAKERGEDPQSAAVYDMCDLLIVGGAGLWLVSRNVAVATELFRFDDVLLERSETAFFAQLLFGQIRETAMGLLAAAALSAVIAFVANRRRPPKPIGLKISYNPLSNIAKRFSKQELLKWLRHWVLLLAFLAVAAALAGTAVHDLARSWYCSERCGLALSRRELAAFAPPVLALLLLNIVIDVISGTMAFLKNLRMSRHDLKQEQKEENGSPEIKGRRRQIMLSER